MDSFERETIVPFPGFVRIGRRDLLWWVAGLSASMIGVSCASAPSAPSAQSAVAGPTTAAPKPAPAASASAPVQPAPTTAPVSTPQKTFQVVVGGPNISFTWTALYLAKDKGFAKQNGLDLDIKNFATDKVALPALLNDEIQMMEGNLSAFFTARASGVPVKVVGANMLGAPMALGVRGDRQIRRLADLYGKVVGISQPGALPDTLIRAMFQKEGLDPEKVTYLPAGGNAERALALLAGKVDAAVVNFVDVPKLEADPNVKILVRISEGMPEYVTASSATTDSVIDKRPEIPLGYMKTMVQGIRYLIANRSEAIAFASKLLEMKTEELTPLFDQYVPMWAVNGHFPREAATYMQDLNLKSGTQDRAISIDAAVTWRFTDEVVATLGKMAQPR